MKRVAIALFILVCTVFIANSVLLGVRIYRGVKLTQGAKAFSARPSQVKGRVLIAGDATGAGIGAESPSDSLAGRLSREFPSAEVRNLSRPGASASDIPGQLSSAGGGSFDVVLIQAGCEDVVRLRDLDAALGAYSLALHAASAYAPHVILMGVADVGLAPAFFPPVSWVCSSRASRLRDGLILLSRETGTEYVDLFRPGRDEPLLKNPGRYLAADGLHPSGDGYALWYLELKRQTALQEYLQAH
jgi:lysophospholipase L1-like esterase